MLDIENYILATSLKEAHAALQNAPGATILGGCGYIRLGTRKIPTAIDISALGLSHITEKDDSIEIGAMTTLREIETSSLLTSTYGSILKQSVESIVGVQLRNCVTIGGSVAGRYPFSDPITALLALEAKLVFHENGKIALSSYLSGKGLNDILLKICLPKDGRQGSFSSIRKSATDYAVLNVAATQHDNAYTIAIGARPGRAVRVPQVEEFLNSTRLTATTAKEAGVTAASNLEFGSNPRGSAEYRHAICPVLIERALLQLL